MSNAQENEDKKSFITLLPATLESLCSMQGVPHDDTILHRLLDIIKQLITTPEDASHSGLFSFLNSATENVSDLNASVLVLVLGVAAHLVSMTTLSTDQWQRVTSLYDVVQSSAVGENSSVGAAYYKSLASVAGCPRGLEWLEKNSTHLQAALSTLERAQSVFLLKAAENFVVASLTSSLEAHATNTTCSSTPPSAMVADTMQFLSTSLTEMAKGRASLLDHMIVSSCISAFHQSMVQVISLLSTCKLFCEWKVGDEKLMRTLAQLALQHPSDKIRHNALQGLVNLVAVMKTDTMEDFLSKEVVSPLLKLVSEGEVERGIAVAAALVNVSQAVAASEALSTLQALHQVPHNLLFGQQIGHARLADLVTLVTTALCNRQRFGRLTPSLLCCVRKAHNCEGVIRLLQSASCTREDHDWSSLSSSWPQGVGAVVVGNQKLLSSLLHMLQQDDCRELGAEQCTATLKSLLHIMRRPLVESRLYSQTCGAFLSILRKQCQRSDAAETAGMHEVVGHMTVLLQRRLVAVQWEVRDTTLEFVRNVISIMPGPSLQRQVLEHHLLNDAWSCVKDGESYPRASAITLATSLTGLPDWWAAFLQDTKVTEDSLIDEMVELLSTDTEAFPRRAAVQLLAALFVRSALADSSQPPASTSPSLVSQRRKICSTMISAMDDFDWEVKAKALEFWEKISVPLLCQVQDCESSNDQGLKSHEDGSGGEGDDACSGAVECRGGGAPYKCGTSAQGKHKRQEEKSSEEYRCVLEGLLQDGFGRAVLAGAQDYDSAVKQKALHILATVLEQAKLGDHPSAKVRKLDNAFKESQAGGLSRAELKGEPETNGDLSTTPSSEQVSLDPVDEFLHKVLELNPSLQLQQLGPSADEYDRKPSSLLEDVMAAARTAATMNEVTLMSEDEFEDADDMFVDCY